jgi:F0F1-type ATP synthase assembly protein I
MGKMTQTVADTQNVKGLFWSMVIDMSWRLAIAVLVPVIGGFELDKAFKTTPLLTIIGFLLAIFGRFVITRQAVQTANRLAVPTTKETKS